MISIAEVGQRARANMPSLKAGILVTILSEDSNLIYLLMKNIEEDMVFQIFFLSWYEYCG